jgi:hypothetical protein
MKLDLGNYITIAMLWAIPVLANIIVSKKKGMVYGAAAGFIACIIAFSIIATYGYFYRTANGLPAFELRDYLIVFALFIVSSVLISVKTAVSVHEQSLARLPDVTPEQRVNNAKRKQQ